MKRLGAWIVALLVISGALVVAVGTAGQAAPDPGVRAATTVSPAAKAQALSCAPGRVALRSRVKAAQDRHWHGPGDQYVQLGETLEGRTASGAWVQTARKSRLMRVGRKARPFKAIAFGAAPMGAYRTFRIVALTRWYNAASRITRRAPFTSATCTLPIPLPSWRPSAGTGFQGTSGLDCAGATCLAFGYNNGPHAALAQWTGSSWAPYDASAISVAADPTSGAATSYASLFSGGSCVSAGFCMAVGRWAHRSGATDGLVATYNGASWTRLGDPPSSWSMVGLNGVDCRSATQCVVVGWYNSGGGTDGHNGGLLYTWTNGVWQRFDTDAPWGVMLYDVSCWAVNQCLSVGTNYSSPGQALALHFDGQTASSIAVPISPSTAGSALLHVSCVSPTFCLAVGRNGNQPLIERWNGAGLVQVAAPAGMTSADAVSCTSASSCTVVGHNASNTLSAEWDGAHLARVTKLAADSGAGISCSAGQHCTAVGQGHTWVR